MIRFFQAGEQKIGFVRQQDGKKLRVYVNRGYENWEIPGGKLLMGHNLRNAAPEWLLLAPMGFCVVEEM